MPRLIDLHCDWPLQYAGEASTFPAKFYPEIHGRRGRENTYFGQSDGYLTDVSAAVVACFRSAADWASRAEPWQALGDLIARIEAEFPGRILIGPEDHARWLDDADGLCWALIGVEGFDALVRAPDDLDQLPSLFERGVRLFQPAYGADNLLAGSSVEGDDRGLTELGRRFLLALLDLSPTGAGPRPILDLAHLNPRAMAEVLDWFEADAARARRIVPTYSHGAPRHGGFVSQRAIALENLGRLRALGGVVGFSVGPPFFSAIGEVRAAIETAAALPFQGRPGLEGIGIGTDFLGMETTLPGLANAEGVLAWLHAAFAPETAAALAAGNARRLLERAVGVAPL